MPELPHRNLDTGMGLERMAAIIQRKSSFFDGDVMQSLIQLGERPRERPMSTTSTPVHPVACASSLTTPAR